MSEKTLFVIDSVSRLIDLSKVDSKGLFIRLEGNVIFVNDVMWESKDVTFSSDDINEILLDLRNMGAVEYVHAADTVYFKDKNDLLCTLTRR